MNRRCAKLSKFYEESRPKSYSDFRKLTFDVKAAENKYLKYNVSQSIIC